MMNSLASDNAPFPKTTTPAPDATFLLARALHVADCTLVQFLQFSPVSNLSPYLSVFLKLFIPSMVLKFVRFLRSFACNLIPYALLGLAL